MSNIEINEIDIIGYGLFHDSESFLDELTYQEVPSLAGGWFGSWFGPGFFNSKFGSHNDYFGYGGYGYGGYGSHSGYSGYGGYSGYSSSSFG